MQIALRLARKGVGATSPNPPVGAVLVKRGKVVGSGWHARAGGEHAEATALKKAGKAARGATLYVTLEPCAHQGKTPPCVGPVLAAGVKEVVVGCADPNPVTARRGIRSLRQGGVKVREGVLASACRELIRPFSKWVTRGVPYVSLKLAQSLDGRTASASGDSKWITSQDARDTVQVLRKSSDAVLVGVKTVLKDDPRLDVRVPASRYPAKVILDSTLRLSPSARIFRTKGRVILAASRAPADRVKKLLDKGAEIIFAPGKDGRVDIRRLMRELGRRGILHVLVEGGNETAACFIDEGLVDDVYFFVAPKLLGGARTMKDARILLDTVVYRAGPDFLFYARAKEE